MFEIIINNIFTVIYVCNYTEYESCVSLFFLCLPVMFCDNYTLNTVTVYSLLIFFSFSGSDEALFFNTIILSNAENLLSSRCLITRSYLS